MKIRTVEELDNRIREDFTWRRHEMTFFNQQLRQGARIQKRSLLRASVAILYAHWEGFIKTSCHYYLCYVASLRLSTEKLSPPLAALSLRALINKSTDSRSSILHNEMVVVIRESAHERARVPAQRDAIQTASNLSFSVLEDILISIGLDPAPYEYARDLINDNLVNYRNKIAHGENEVISEQDWDELESEVLTLMESVATEIVNSASNKRYFAAGHHPVV